MRRLALKRGVDDFTTDTTAGKSACRYCGIKDSRAYGATALAESGKTSRLV
jgi:hypothetical protein